MQAFALAYLLRVETLTPAQKSPMSVRAKHDHLQGCADMLLSKHTGCHARLPNAASWLVANVEATPKLVTNLGSITAVV